MAEPAQLLDENRTHAARIAYAMLRCEEPMACPLKAYTPPGMPVVGTDAYVFTPSWRAVSRADIVPFLAGLPSPVLLSPTTTRGMIALTLVHELSGERRRWAEKTLNNATNCLDGLANQLGLDETSQVRLDLPGEAVPYSFATVRLWTQQFGVQVGWSLSPLKDDPRAQARLVVRRSDGTWSHQVDSS